MNTEDVNVVRMLSVPWAEGITEKKHSAHAIIEVRHRMWADYEHEKRVAELLRDMMKSKGLELPVSLMDMAVYTRNAYGFVSLSPPLCCMFISAVHIRCW